MGDFAITRQEIVDAAKSLVGVPFLHQGRDPRTGVDCVGLLIAVGKIVGYPFINDVEAYRRVPSANVIRTTLEMSCDPIPKEEVRMGDIYLMRIGGVKPRHTSIRISDEWDVRSGVEPMLVHAAGYGASGRVKVETVRQHLGDIVMGFRARGIVD